MKKKSPNISWQAFLKKDNKFKQSFFSHKNQIYDCINSYQFDRNFLDYIYNLTNKIRLINKSAQGAKFLQSLLAHKRAMLYFMQPSTRTYLSFKTACQILGIQTSDVRDTQVSSESKGESIDDTLQTFSSYFDIIIMRHFEANMCERAAWCLSQSDRPIPIINAGSGKDQHPTQALLDIYTLRRSFENRGGLQNKTILLAGDLLRGRTVRSLALLLRHFSNIKLILASPQKFNFKQDISDKLDDYQIEYIETEELNKYLPKADAVYMTRIQDEYDDDEFQSEKSYIDFSLTLNNLDFLKKEAVILHPLPRREEIAPEIDNDKRAIYWRQERNGMWTRVALLAIILGVDKNIQLF